MLRKLVFPPPIEAISQNIRALKKKNMPVLRISNKIDSDWKYAVISNLCTPE